MTYCSYCMSPIKTTYKVCPYCGKGVHAEVPAHHLLPGTILNGKILVGTALGEGGFGITYLGRDLNLDIKVAIKEYYPNGYVNRSNSYSSDITFSISEDGKDFFTKGKERFLREARILAKFSSEPGVVEVRDFFEQNNTAYIVMEYLDGQDLKQYLKTSGPMAPGKALSLLMPVMKTLTKIHAQGLIHRDISPDNIRMSNGVTKLLDFGAARDVSSATNKSLSVMLKPGYAPEEQYRSKGEQGPWTDVYALCATMYTCITGVTPDDATQRLFNDELKLPSAMGITIGKDFENTLMKGMAVLQKDRFQSVEELIKSFNGEGAPAPEPAAQAVMPNAQPKAPARVAPAPVPVPPKKKKSGKGILVGMIVTLLILGLIGGGAYLLWYNGYLDSFIYGDDTEDTTEQTTEATTPEATEPVYDYAQAEKIAVKYVEAYFAPDSEDLNSYCEVNFNDYLSYEADQAGLSLKEYLLSEYGVSGINELYSMTDESDYEEYCGLYGDDYTYTVDVIETVVYNETQLAELCEEADSYYEGEYPGHSFVDTGSIEAACDVQVSYTVGGSLDSETVEGAIVMVYTDGEWLVLN